MNQREKRDIDIHQPRMYKDQLEICCELQMVAHCFFFYKKSYLNKIMCKYCYF